MTHPFSASPPVETGVLPLAGFTIGITASRRREELENLLVRRGARVMSAPAIRIVPVSDDGDLLAATRACLTQPPDLLIATTGVGFRGWMEAADGWGLANALTDVLSRARIVTRGPKATGAVRAAGLCEEWSPASESSGEVLDYLLADELDGVRVAIQLHGEPQLELVRALRGRGCDVLDIPVYRWVLPEDVRPLRRLTEATIERQVDALAFTSAPAVASMLRVAHGDGVRDELLDALRTDVIAVCVGSTCAEPLVREGVDFLLPDRARLGALVRTVAKDVPELRTRVLVVNGRVIELRGRSAIIAGEVVDLASGPWSVLSKLATRPGAVFAREDLLGCLPGDSADTHAVEMTVARLRTALRDPASVVTVVKRGYRLNVEA